jgi:hypothetical protein
MSINDRQSLRTDTIETTGLGTEPDTSQIWSTPNRLFLTDKALDFYSESVLYESGSGLRLSSVGFEVLIALVTKSSVVYDVTQCSPLKVNRRFGGTSRLHHECRRISQTRDQREKQLLRRLNFNWLDCIISQKRENFILRFFFCLSQCLQERSGIVGQLPSKYIQNSSVIASSDDNTLHTESDVK